MVFAEYLPVILSNDQSWALPAIQCLPTLTSILCETHHTLNTLGLWHSHTKVYNTLQGRVLPASHYYSLLTRLWKFSDKALWCQCYMWFWGRRKERGLYLMSIFIINFLLKPHRERLPLLELCRSQKRRISQLWERVRDGNSSYSGKLI